MRTFADKLGYVLQGYSRFSTLPDLAQADLIIPLDHESDDFTKVHKNAIRGEVRPFGMFLPAGSSPYLTDPYSRDDDHLDSEEIYNEIIHSIRLGSSKILQAIPGINCLIYTCLKNFFYGTLKFEFIIHALYKV